MTDVWARNGPWLKNEKAPQVEKLAGPCESWLLDLGANRINSLYRLTDVTIPTRQRGLGQVGSNATTSYSIA